MRKYWLGILLVLIMQTLTTEKSASSLERTGYLLSPLPPATNPFSSLDAITTSLPTADYIPQRMWITPAEIAALPMSGPAWTSVFNAAQKNTNSPDISDQNDSTDVNVLAKALVYVRTGQSSYRNQVVNSIMAAMGTEGGASTGILPVARNVQAYVIAADLINLGANPAEDAAFRLWLTTLRNFVFDGGGGALSIITCHEKRPNNFGTHCGATRIAIALYLNDTADLDRAATVFKGWLGDRSAYTGFSFGSLSWQCNPNAPVGINPAGCTIQGHNVDGVLPDDQRRSGNFTWPPPKENYVWEALQGAVVQANLLNRAGYPAWEWQNQALRRAINWLYTVDNYAPTGDDRWEPWLINEAYQSNFAVVSGVTPGKGMGWTDWTSTP